MKFVKVTASPDDDVIAIRLEFRNTKRVFHRPVNETITRTVERMMLSMEKTRKKKSKREKVKSVDGHELLITLQDSCRNEICMEQESIKAWKSSSFLNINNEEYRILFNPPSITKMVLSSLPLVGIPLVPILEFALALPKYSSFLWSRSLEVYSIAEPMECDLNEKSSNGLRKRLRSTDETCHPHEDTSQSELEWEKISSQMTYTPTMDDVGHILKLEVKPGNESYPAPHVSSEAGIVSKKSGVVHTGPNLCLFDERHILTCKPCLQRSKFRMVSYNILADCYANSDLASSELFPYCSKEFLDINYRLQLIQKELLGYHSDVICLQEVDRFVFEDYLAPMMSLHHYAAAFANKRNTKEGLALFYNRSKFKLVSVDNKVICESLLNDDVNATLKQFVKLNAKFETRITNKGMCALISVLQCVDDESRYLIVINLHLYWHPRASNIRLIQMMVVMNLLGEKVNSLRSSIEGQISCIVCGDFNSNPRSGVVEYLLSGGISAQHVDWYSGGKDEFHNSNAPPFQHEFHLSNACGSPPYTNYVAGFIDCLDYVFIDTDHLKVDKVVDNPRHELVTMHSGLPSSIAPSDHIAQIVDLSWIN